jgi:hypothetical protein
MNKRRRRCRKYVSDKPDISDSFFVTAINYAGRKRLIDKIIFICDDLDEANSLYHKLTQIPYLRHLVVTERKPTAFSIDKYRKNINKYRSGEYFVTIVNGETNKWNQLVKNMP